MILRQNGKLPIFSQRTLKLFLQIPIRAFINKMVGFFPHNFAFCPSIPHLPPEWTLVGLSPFAWQAKRLHKSVWVTPLQNIYDLQRIKANPGLQVCKSSTISLHQMTMMHTVHRSYVHEQLSIQVLQILENQSGDGKVEFKEFKVRITILSIHHLHGS